MGHRITKVYTRTGDKGTTQVGRKQRVAKNDALVELFGGLDELNSVIGLIVAQPGVTDSIKNCLARLQQELFDLGAELFLPEVQRMQQTNVDWLENQIDKFNQTLPFLEEFVLPGGHPAAAQCHFARSVCRRAERQMVAFSQQYDISLFLLSYLNRLSDLLFVIARIINVENHVPETLWKNK